MLGKGRKRAKRAKRAKGGTKIAKIGRSRKKSTATASARTSAVPPKKIAAQAAIRAKEEEEAIATAMKTSLMQGPKKAFLNKAMNEAGSMYRKFVKTPTPKSKGKGPQSQLSQRAPVSGKFHDSILFVFLTVMTRLLTYCALTCYDFYMFVFITTGAKRSMWSGPTKHRTAGTIVLGAIVEGAGSSTGAVPAVSAPPAPAAAAAAPIPLRVPRYPYAGGVVPLVSAQTVVAAPATVPMGGGAQSSLATTSGTVATTAMPPPLPAAPAPAVAPAQIGGAGSGAASFVPIPDASQSSHSGLRVEAIARPGLSIEGGRTRRGSIDLDSIVRTYFSFSFHFILCVCVYDVDLN